MTVYTVEHGIPQQGTTAARPTNAHDGACYFDLDLNIPIFWDAVNSAWLDALGRDVVGGVLSIAESGTPVDGSTGADRAAPGCLYQDTLSAKLYINTNTKASPLWTVVGAQTT